MSSTALAHTCWRPCAAMPGRASASTFSKSHGKAPQPDACDEATKLPVDCDTCRWMDPRTYDRVGSMSAVVEQPGTPEARRAALQALVACPTHSIHVRKQARVLQGLRHCGSTRTTALCINSCIDCHSNQQLRSPFTSARVTPPHLCCQEPGEMSAAQHDFPLPTICEDIYHCGQSSQDLHQMKLATHGRLLASLERPKYQQPNENNLITRRVPLRGELWRGVMAAAPGAGRQRPDGLAAISPRTGQAPQGHLQHPSLPPPCLFHSTWLCPLSGSMWLTAVIRHCVELSGDMRLHCVNRSWAAPVTWCCRTETMWRITPSGLRRSAATASSTRWMLLIVWLQVVFARQCLDCCCKPPSHDHPVKRKIHMYLCDFPASLTTLCGGLVCRARPTDDRAQSESAKHAAVSILCAGLCAAWHFLVV